MIEKYMIRSLSVDSYFFFLLTQAERSAKMKAEMKAKTMRRFLLSQKHIVYTEPLEIRAGTTVDVLYNPSNTVLNGKPEVWFRCSFNLWMHPGGALPPHKMVKSRDGSLLKATGLSSSSYINVISRYFFFVMCTDVHMVSNIYFIRPKSKGI
jgi:hypothetical protein